jgi:hypothetical protein
MAIGYHAARRMALISVYRSVCQYCRTTKPDFELEVDHIDPISAGGEDSLYNVTLACGRCNRIKSGTSLPEPGRSFLKVLAKRNATKTEIVIIHLSRGRNAPAQAEKREAGHRTVPPYIFIYRQPIPDISFSIMEKLEPSLSDRAGPYSVTVPDRDAKIVNEGLLWWLGVSYRLQSKGRLGVLVSETRRHGNTFAVNIPKPDLLRMFLHELVS